MNTVYTWFTHFRREFIFVAIERFGGALLAKIWQKRALKHFKGPGAVEPFGLCNLMSSSQDTISDTKSIQLEVNGVSKDIQHKKLKQNLEHYDPV